MTFRDANAADMTDYFNFHTQQFREPPTLADPPDPGPGLDVCHDHGLFPPLPPDGAIGRNAITANGLPKT